jgi:AraC family transcriptional regulator
MYLFTQQKDVGRSRAPLQGSVLGFSLLSALATPVPFRRFGIKYVEQGVEHYKVNGRHYAVRPGEYLLVNALCRGRVDIDAPTPVMGLCADLDPVLMDGMLNAIQQAEATNVPGLSSFFTSEEFLENRYSAEGTRVGALMRSFVERFRHDPCGPHVVTGSAYMALAEAVVLDHLPVIPGLRRVQALRAGTRKDIYRRVEMGRSLIHDRFNERLEVADMAAGAAMSEYHFFRAFRAVHGLTPHQYLLDLRLRHAQELLRRGVYQMADVALMCGFVDHPNFSKAFKRRFGLSPSTWSIAIRRN